MNLPDTIKQTTKSDEKFKIVSDFTPSGDQPAAIKTLVQNLNGNDNEQVLLGVTGSGTVSYTHLTLPTKRIV